MSADSLVIISPHRKSIQNEFIPRFKSYYKEKFGTEIQVDWLDQGGTSDDVRFIRSKFASNPKSSGVDVFWGGGMATFIDLSHEKFLATFRADPELLKDIPQQISGVPLYDEKQTWYATAMSSFGIFYNKKIMKYESLPEPSTWTDLGRVEFFEQLMLTDPRRSGTATTMNMMIIGAYDWQDAWNLFYRIAGNTKKFTHSSTDPIKALITGDASVTMAIDFYANAKISEIGEKNLGLILPPSATIIDPDPAAILKGAPNRQAAERFINFLLTKEAQKLLILPKGSEGGPKDADLGRMAVNAKAYEETEGRRIWSYNPFDNKKFMLLDGAESAALQGIVSDLMGAIIVDTHAQLREAWKLMIKEKTTESLMHEFAAMPVSKDELKALAKKWDDEVFRNKTINSWIQFAKTKFDRIIKNNGKPS